MQDYCKNCGGWCFLEDEEWICIACGEHTKAKVKDKPRLLTKIEEEMKRAREAGLRKEIRRWKRDYSR